MSDSSRSRSWAAALVRLVLGALTLSSLGCCCKGAAAEGPAQKALAPGVSRDVRHIALRLGPGQDLGQELKAAVEAYEASAIGVVTCVGSLTEVTIRYANQEEATTLRGHFEIVSLVGTLEPGGGHLHIAVADGEGRTFAGHLMPGSAVYTTAEIVLVALDDLRFTRKPDPVTTYHELSVERR